jgi:Arc/MetJ-type ribon-helix-helix transcriptional regulator
MGTSKRLNVTVPEEMAEDWKQAVEEEAVAQSVSELIRTSVSLRLDGHLAGSQDSQQAQDGAQSMASEEILRYLEQMDGALDSIHERLSRLEEESRASSEAGGVDLQKVVARLLPEVPLSPTVKEQAVIDYYNSGKLVTAEDLAQRIDAGIDEMLNALINAEERHPDIVSRTVSDGTIYFWREP